MSAFRSIAAAVGIAAVASISAAGAGPASNVITHPLTGFAAAGFDPVAYFADGEAREGLPDHEASWAGVAWRFANEGNLQAFLEAPEIYAPQFGGHCVVALARGYAAEGDPRVWAIHNSRLHFFHSDANRRIFATDPDSFLAEAAQNWKALFPY